MASPSDWRSMPTTRAALRQDHAFHRIGDGEHAPRRPWNGLAAREPPQVARLMQIGADCGPRRHRALRIVDRLALYESQPGPAVNPTSQFMGSTVLDRSPSGLILRTEAI